jgi:hypothetical protein
MIKSTDTDERTVAVTNASYRWGYLFLAFGLLLSVGYRSFRRGEPSWDLLALVVLSGVITTLYQGSFRILSARSARVALFVVALGVAMSVMFRLVR